MKVSIEWLKQYTPVDLPVKTLTEGLTMSGSKVEGVEELFADITRVVTGRITKIERHPGADKLQVCQVDIGYESLQIITAATNVFEGAIIPVALDGSTLAKGLKIKSGKLRGELSQGMMCSIEELGLTGADFPSGAVHGIFILPDTTALGQDIFDALDIRDTVIEFEITSNRVDCFAVEGLARETAVTFDLPFSEIRPQVQATSPRLSQDLASVEITAPDLCYRYVGRVVENVRVASSPDWLRRRLRCAGIRPINNIVDITNYVMLELGQPMHAFDLDQVAGRSIIVRRAAPGEVLRTLDSVDRTLDDQMLVIADRDRAVALAGVMGAENSEITAGTTTILLESATFNPQAVRRAAKLVGLRTDASSRFEKGLDVYNASRAIDRACELIEQLGCGDVLKGRIDAWPYHPEAVTLLCRPKVVNAFLGTSLDAEDMSTILTRLGCIVTEVAGDLSVQVPSYRPDLESEADLAEEIARIHGYNKIEPTLLSGKQTTLGGLTPSQKALEKIKDLMIGQGFFEACTYSFESPRELDKLLLPENHPLRQVVTIRNPLGEDYSIMRPSMVPSLLEMASTNWNRSVDEGRLFELAYTYQPRQLPMTELPDEKLHLAAVLFDETQKGKGAANFLAMKGVIEELFLHLGILEVTFQRSEQTPWLHPGQSAQIRIGQEIAGTIGVVHPDVAERFAAPAGTVLLDLLADVVLARRSDKRVYQPLPKFPAVTRDLALLVDSDILVADLQEAILAAGGRNLESVRLFDVYSGKQVPEGKKSIAFNLVFRSAEKTLSDDEIAPAIKKILKKLDADFAAQLRE
ncbi:MAG: phenylalanine--tRNA ligase subunit beta [Eubacteriales bacterium]|nr:phenylalanine--tRNA ligase subunit beta [Eubacteriales bacterium]